MTLWHIFMLWCAPSMIWLAVELGWNKKAYCESRPQSEWCRAP